MESRKGLMMVILSRFLLIPAFYFTAKYGDQGWMIMLTSFLGLSNGYLTVCVLTAAPKGYKVQNQTPCYCIEKFNFYSISGLTYMQFRSVGSGTKCFGKPARVVSFRGHICRSDAWLVVAHRQRLVKLILVNCLPELYSAIWQVFIWKSTMWLAIRSVLEHSFEHGCLIICLVIYFVQSICVSNERQFIHRFSTKNCCLYELCSSLWAKQRPPEVGFLLWCDCAYYAGFIWVIHRSIKFSVLLSDPMIANGKSVKHRGTSH